MIKFRKARYLKFLAIIAICMLLPLEEVYPFQRSSRNLRLPVGDSVVRIDDADELALCKKVIGSKFSTEPKALKLVEAMHEALSEQHDIDDTPIMRFTLPDVIEKSRNIKELEDICAQILVLAIQMAEKEMDMKITFEKAVPRITSIANNIEELISIMVLARHLVGRDINPENFLVEDIPVEIVKLKEEEILNRRQVFQDIYDLEISSKKPEGKALTLEAIADNSSQSAYLNTKGVSLDGTRSAEVPKNQKILVFEIGKDTAIAYQGNNITEFKKNKNNVNICTLDTTKDIYKQVMSALNKFKPNIVMLPNPVILPNGDFLDNDFLKINKAVKEWATGKNENVLGLGYETIESLTRHNLFIYYNEEELDVKVRSCNQQKSQMTRVPYQAAMRHSNSSNSIGGRAISDDIRRLPKKPYAEAFTVLKVGKDGEVVPVDKENPNKIYTSLEDALNTDGKVNFFIDGPHTDDLHIAIAILAKRIQEKGGNIIHSIFMTGHRAFIQGIDDRLFRIRRDFEDWHIEMLEDALTDGLYLPNEWRDGIEIILNKLGNNQHLSKDEEALAKKMLKIKIREQETLKSDEVLRIKDTRFYRFPAYDHTDTAKNERILGADLEYNEFYETYQALEEMYKSNPNIVVAIPSILDKHPDHRFTHKTRLSAVKEFAKNKGIEIPIVLYVAPWFGPDNMYTYLSKEEQTAKFKKAESAKASLKEAIANRENALGIADGELVQFEFGADPHSVYDEFGMSSEGLKVFWLSKQDDANVVYSAGEPSNVKYLPKYLVKKQPQIDPSVLPIKKEDNIPERIATVVQAQTELGVLVPMVHWDVIKLGEEGAPTRIVQAIGGEESVDELSAEKLGEVVAHLNKKSLSCNFDVHLMVEDPTEAYIKGYIEKGASMVTLHWEAFIDKDELGERIRFIKSLGCLAGLAFNPGVEIDDVLEFIKSEERPLYNDIDLFLQMSVDPGAGGQGFKEEVLPKIKKLKEALKEVGSSAIIEVDGGVKPIKEIMEPLIESGVNLLVAGSAILSKEQESIKHIKDKFQKFDDYLPQSVRLNRNSALVCL